RRASDPLAEDGVLRGRPSKSRRTGEHRRREVGRPRSGAATSRIREPLSRQLLFRPGLALEDAVERAAVDAEQLGGPDLVATRLVEHERDVPALELLERHPAR